jgi:hypothetical protein
VTHARRRPTSEPKRKRPKPRITGLRCLALLALLTSCSASRGTATLTWVPPTQNTDGSPLTGLAGYYIYFGQSPRMMDHVIQLRDPGVRSYVVKDLEHGDYYFSIVAYTATGVQSDLTAPVHKVIP